MGMQTPCTHYASSRMAKRVSCHYNSNMQKFLKGFWVLFFFLACFSFPQTAQAESSVSVPVLSDASDLIAGVNAIRSSNGISHLQTNSILMSIAQQQAEFDLSVRSMTDSGPGGSRPYQRALAAGYLLAGDLSSGGIIAELLYAGVGIGPDAAVTWWDNDSYHHSMLVSTSFADVGAGVASSGNTVYFVLVEALSTGGTPVAYTPPAPLYPVAPTLVPNTPNADGSIDATLIQVGTGGRGFGTGRGRGGGTGLPTPAPSASASGPST